MSGRTLVLGVGNVLWADEGVGPSLAAALAGRICLAAGDIVDGGTQGLYLLPLITESRRLLLFDAVDLDRPAGDVVLLRDRDITQVFSTRVLSLHQTSLQDLLAAGQFVGWQPERLALIGVQVENVDDWGRSLTPVVERSLEQALALAIGVLEAWGEPMERLLAVATATVPA